MYKSKFVVCSRRGWILLVTVSWKIIALWSLDDKPISNPNNKVQEMEGQRSRRSRCFCHFSFIIMVSHAVILYTSFSIFIQKCGYSSPVRDALKHLDLQASMAGNRSLPQNCDCRQWTPIRSRPTFLPPTSPFSYPLHALLARALCFFFFFSSFLQS